MNKHQKVHLHSFVLQYMYLFKMVLQIHSSGASEVGGLYIYFKSPLSTFFGGVIHIIIHELCMTISRNLRALCCVLQQLHTVVVQYQRVPFQSSQCPSGTYSYNQSVTYKSCQLMVPHLERCIQVLLRTVREEVIVPI